jgi:DnaK suppressor protein
MPRKIEKPKKKQRVPISKATKGHEKPKAKTKKSVAKISSTKSSGKTTAKTKTPKPAVKPNPKTPKAAVKPTTKAVTKATPSKAQKKVATKVITKAVTKAVTKTKKEIAPPMPTKSSAPKVMKVTSARQAKLKKILLDKRAKIMKEMQQQLGQSLNDEQQRRLESAMDSGDQALLDLEREMGISLQEMRNKERQLIDNAITRLNEGSYGMCADCGEEISEKRLEALPFATLCVACQSKRELLEKIERGEQRM